ncbi:hypothetical protein [Oceanicaulis sp.]|uniref:hypothetical protein n=1 Tax=Oceanicaulis sp. TaxID=1924941 RepID=UPI003D2C1FC6
MLVQTLVALICFGVSTITAFPSHALALPPGSGVMEVETPGVDGPIVVHYHRGSGHSADDPIIVVLPGGGRNGDSYRDSWIDSAEQYDLLVLAPSFDERRFPGPINYNLAGMIADDANLRTLETVTLREAPEEWLFARIEAIFDAAVARSDSAQTQYDLFGHSAGGQIVHRMTLFAPDTRIRRALAANSGWYTIPSSQTAFPYGLDGAPMDEQQLETAFERDLVVFLGELDNASETRGHLRHTPETDSQGLHRLARGQSFMRLAAEQATSKDAEGFAWECAIVIGVGHDYRRMGQAAAEYLYGASENVGICDTQ